MKPDRFPREKEKQVPIDNPETPNYAPQVRSLVMQQKQGREIKHKSRALPRGG